MTVPHDAPRLRRQNGTGQVGKAAIMGPTKITPTAPSGTRRPSGAAAVFDMDASTAVALIAFVVEPIHRAPCSTRRPRLPAPRGASLGHNFRAAAAATHRLTASAVPPAWLDLRGGHWASRVPQQHLGTGLEPGNVEQLGDGIVRAAPQAEHPVTQAGWRGKRGRPHRQRPRDSR